MERPLRNIYHPAPKPDTEPRVPLSSLRPGQSFVYTAGGTVRTVRQLDPFQVIRHDPDKDWITDVDPAGKMVIVVERVKRK